MISCLNYKLTRDRDQFPEYWRWIRCLRNMCSPIIYTLGIVVWSKQANLGLPEHPWWIWWILPRTTVKTEGLRVRLLTLCYSVLTISILFFQRKKTWTKQWAQHDILVFPNLFRADSKHHGRIDKVLVSVVTRMHEHIGSFALFALEAAWANRYNPIINRLTKPKD